MPRLTRRRFLASSAAVALPLPALATLSDTTVIAAPATAQLVPPEYPATQVWAYDGAVPGAGLRVAQGTRIRRRFVNNLPQDSTIHWHGIRIDNAMDGAAGLTQDAVAPGAEFLYDFVVPDAGTFWYHPHRNTLEQVSRGLTAPLIVEEAEPPEVDAELVLTINDWRLDETAQIYADFDNLHDRAHGGRIGNHLTVNGAPDMTRDVNRHDRLRLRLINAASGRIVEIGAMGLSGWVMALDGMPLAQPMPFEGLALGPAQRADLIVDVTAAAGETAYLTSIERDGAWALANLTVGVGPAAARPMPAPLPPNRIAPLDLPGARSVQMLMEGGAMGQLTQATVPGQGSLGMREMAGQGLVWALNGVAGMPEAPMLTAALGETIRIPLVNRSVWPHAMHLHGHHFHEITANGPGPARDTLLMDGQSETEIAFVADNPGDWMFHCHMLAHQAAGMMTWLRVTG